MVGCLNPFKVDLRGFRDRHPLISLPGRRVGAKSLAHKEAPGFMKTPRNTDQMLPA